MANELAIIRLKGSAGVRSDMEDTLRMLGLRRKHTMAILPRTDSIMGMIKKVNPMVTWGEADDELAAKLNRKIVRLKPPVKGFRGMKKPYPKGDLGYRGKEINELIKRMLVE